MKYISTLLVAILISISSYARVELYLGARAGAGLMLTRNQLNNFSTLQGTSNLLNTAHTWTANVKAEALLGFWRMRVGYRFMYNFEPSDISTPPANAEPQLTSSQNTTYFNSSQSHFFAHYGVIEFVVVKTKHFDFSPGMAFGSYTGFKVDNTTHDMVPLSNTTHLRFTFGLETNFEIVLGRWSILLVPNYYLFDLQDKVTSHWHRYEHCLGGDVGFRVNLIKPKE